MARVILWLLTLAVLGGAAWAGYATFAVLPPPTSEMEISIPGARIQ